MIEKFGEMSDLEGSEARVLASEEELKERAENLESGELTMKDLMQKLSEAEIGNEEIRKNGELSEGERKLSGGVEAHIKLSLSEAYQAVEDYEKLKKERENN